MDVNDIVRLFSPKSPVNIDIRNTNHGENDFRETLLVDLGDERIAVKLASNGFTDEKHLFMWERIAKEYRDLGYYCPHFNIKTENAWSGVRSFQNTDPRMN